MENFVIRIASTAVESAFLKADTIRELPGVLPRCGGKDPVFGISAIHPRPVASRLEWKPQNRDEPVPRYCPSAMLQARLLWCAVMSTINAYSCV